MKVPLFDVDGTLVKTANPVHKKAFSYAFEEIYKVKAIDNEINPEGMTDNQIILEVLKIHGLKEVQIKKNIKKATEKMNYYFQFHKHEAEIKPLSGVVDLLSKLKEKNLTLGILSGNVEGIAWTKLQSAEIKKFFDFGAFGDEAFNRVDLLKIAKENAYIILRKDFQIKNFVIVGDTPKDIACAREAGIKVIAVATGIYSYEDLKKEKPDLLIHNFESEGEKVIKFLND